MVKGFLVNVGVSPQFPLGETLKWYLKSSKIIEDFEDSCIKFQISEKGAPFSFKIFLLSRKGVLLFLGVFSGFLIWAFWSLDIIVYLKEVLFFD